MSRRLTTILVVPLLALGLTFAALGLPKAYAASGNPHFVKSGTSGSLSGSTLNVVFKEAGLAAGSIETITVSGVGTATYQCYNNGGKHPQAANKETVSSTQTSTGNFPVDQNGNLTGSLQLQAPGPGNFSCPAGQYMVGPTNVSFTNVMLVDQTSGATYSLGNFG